MILIDTALKKLQAENKAIRVGMVGSGFMGRAIALQICTVVPGMQLVAISNRTLASAKLAYEQAGINNPEKVDSLSQLEDNIKKKKYSITENPELLCGADGIDVIIEVTGAVEFGAHVALNAIKGGKHLILVNAELDGTVGPILKIYADRAGVIFTTADGDQPGVTMNLYRFVKSLGINPLLCGNIKGLHDPYRNPTTQEGYARKWGINVNMVTSAADGTKISFEQALIANGTGMRVGKRGMYGPVVASGTPLREAISFFTTSLVLQEPGIVDYVVGAEPAPGVFVIGTTENPQQKHYLNYYKLGEGPFYLFYTPYHLCHLEIPNTVARAVLFKDATLSPLRPCVDVVTTAKTNLKSGQIIDGLGGYMTYGLCENSSKSSRDRLLPIGVSEGCVLNCDIEKDQVITYDDVIIPPGRLIDKLRLEQAEYFKLDF